MKLYFSLLPLIGVAIAPYAMADDLFSANISINGQPAVYQTYDNILDLGAQYTNKNLKQTFPNYTQTSAVYAEVNYAGLNDIRLQFNENSNTLILNIPSADIYKEFSGDTRNASRKALVEYFKNAPKALNEALVGSSFENPVNQNRVTSTQANYEASQIATGLTSELSKANLLSQSQSVIAFAPRFGRYTQSGLDTDVISLPLAYAKYLPEHQFTLVIDAPITISQTDKAIAGQGSIGVGINSAITQNWYLMPQIRVGAVLSPDFGASASTFSSGFTSNYRFYPTAKSAVSLINVVSYYNTRSLKIGEYKGEYDLSNFVFRNGLELEQRLDTVVFGQPLVIKAHLARTDYTGDAVYSKYSHDAGVSFGIRNPNKESWIKDFRLGFNVNQAQHDIKGFSLNAGYTF